MRRVLLCALVVFAAFTGSLAKEEQLKGDLALMQGKWKAWMSADHWMDFEVQGTRFKMTHLSTKGVTVPWNGTLVIDEKPDPRHLTWTQVKSGGNALPDNQCLYEIHKDTWLIIGGGPNTRPERFFSGGGDGSQTLVLKREKVDAAKETRSDQ